MRYQANGPKPTLVTKFRNGFTTSAAENPTLTIVALAIRQADYIAEQMGQRSI